jgi:hypothetical protein
MIDAQLARPTDTSVGSLLQFWRKARQLSQLAAAFATGRELCHAGEHMRSPFLLGVLLVTLSWPLAVSATPAQAAAPLVAGPPPPAAPPPVFDAREYRKAQRTARQRRHELQEPRPSSHTRRRVLGFVAIGAGAATTFTGVNFLLIEAMSRIGPHSGEPDSLGQEERRAIGLCIGLGLPVLGVGIWAVRTPVTEIRNTRLSVAPTLGWRSGAQRGLVAKVTL